MAAPFVVACTHCGAKLKLKSDAAAGKKVRCPKCQEVFVAAAVGGGAPSKSGKPRPPKDDFDFGNISEDDYTPPPGSEGSEEDFDDLPASPVAARKAAGKSGGKKKSKKRASDGPGFGKIALIGALVLLGIGLVGGVGYGVYTLVQGLGGGANRFAWLPEDADFVFEVDVADAWNSGVIQPLRNGEFGKSLGAKLQAEAKTNPADIDRVVVGGKVGSQKPMVVIYGSKPIDRADAAKNSTVSDYGGYQLYTNTNGTAIFFPEDRVAVAGIESDVKAAIDRQGAFSANERFSDLPSRGQIRFAATNLSASLKNLPQMPATPGFDREKVKSVHGSIALTKDIGLQFTSVCGDEATAQSLLQSIEKDKADGLAKLSEQRVQMESNPLLKLSPMRNLIGGAEQAMESYQVSASGNAVLVEITVPGQLLEDAVSAAGPMLSGLMRSLPSPGGAAPLTPPGSTAPASESENPAANFEPSEAEAPLTEPAQAP